ncbi:hypothetical protein JW916_15390 [Candidatus Sumerlaeota bacterium]|nr:hypothetical protein [Candidatus Sumerlaeota bacterium]
MGRFLKRLWTRLNSAQIGVLSFALACLLGGVVLSFPIASETEPLRFLDAVFTATSATCVTGLIVVDTPTRFSFFGEAAILVLIQAGGSGIMMFSTMILFVMKRRASINVRDAVGGSFLKLRRYSLRELLKLTLLMTVLFEGAGAAILFLRWWPEYGAGRALWLAVFHSVSAFCNAGFSLFSDSLVRWADDPIVNAVVMSLIVAGGIGFFVVTDLWDTIRRHPDPARRRVCFHTKIVLGMTAVLIVAPAILIFLLERGATLASCGTSGAAMRALFQSVTARTAGFNTVDIGAMSNASLFLIACLMFVGAAPGSTGGGIKVTALGVVLIVVYSRFKRMGSISIFGRSISRGNLERAVVLILLAGALVCVVTFLLLATEPTDAPHSEFLDILFESVSAFGTVGLSTGVTPNLSDLGRLIVILTMFTGRVGPLVLVYAIGSRAAERSYRYPEEQIMIG